MSKDKPAATPSCSRDVHHHRILPSLMVLVSTQFFSESKELKSSAPPTYCSLLFGSRRILSVFVTSAAEIFVHQAARPITALVRGAAPVLVFVIPFPVVESFHAALHVFVGLIKS